MQLNGDVASYGQIRYSPHSKINTKSTEYIWIPRLWAVCIEYILDQLMYGAIRWCVESSRICFGDDSMLCNILNARRTEIYWESPFPRETCLLSSGVNALNRSFVFVKLFGWNLEALLKKSDFCIFGSLWTKHYRSVCCLCKCWMRTNCKYSCDCSHTRLADDDGKYDTSVVRQQNHYHDTPHIHSLRYTLWNHDTKISWAQFPGWRLHRKAYFI